MFKKALAKRHVRKALVFTGALAIALPVWGSTFATSSGEAEAGFLSGLAASSQAEMAVPAFRPSQADSPGDFIGDELPPLSAQGEQDIAALHPESAWQDDPNTTEPVAQAAPAMVEEQPAPGFVFSEKIPLSRELQEYTFAQCLENGLSYELVLALMWRESRFQITAVGYNQNGTQDSGVMQINDVNRGWLLSELGITDLMDPRQNIAAGTAMLGRLTEKYGEHNALMAYQYGEAGMQRKLEQGVTTNAQVELVYAKRAEFEKLLDTSDMA